MSLEDTYKQFLAAPNASLLASNASLHYVTTLFTVNGPNEILKHLAGQIHDLKKNEEKLLSVVEGRNALAAEVHTTIEFIEGGGAYLTTLDDNFLADRVVTFPIIHFVTFDSDGKIQQVRLSWDQGSLLKLIDVIGKTGRNWPIHAGKDQIRLISASVKTAGDPTEDSTTEDSYRSRGNSQNATRDPHASLALFTPRAKTVAPESLPAAAVARNASAKPPQRNYHDLFVGNDSDQSPTTPTKAAKENNPSPAKPAVTASKAGAGKNYAPSRLFETDEEEQPSPPPTNEPVVKHLHRPNPAKFQHFDFADGSDPSDVAKPAPLKDMKKSKHGSQWDFGDFATPQKPAPGKILRNDVRHWGTGDDEGVDSPVKQKHVFQPRKDTQTHIEFQDDGTPDGRPVVHRPRGANHNSGLGLYKNNVYDEEERGEAGGEDFNRLDTISNMKDRSKDFDAHFSMSDKSPAVKSAPNHITNERAKVIKMMDASWDTYDESPTQKENVRSETSKPTALASKEPLSESTNAASHRNDNPKGIATAGDGMGGRKGAGRQWGIGDDSDNEEVGITRPNKYNATKNRPTGGDFWDF